MSDVDTASAGEAVFVPPPRRLTVALAFHYQEKWIGGLYYVRNLVSALGELPAEIRPTLIVISNDSRDLEYLKSETGYRDLRRMAPGARGSLPGSFGPLGALLPRNPRKNDPAIDVVLMGSIRGLEHRAVQWIPDFQEERFPEFFRPGEIHARRRLNARALAKHRHVMVSSADVKSDLELFYGKQENRIHVIRFASFADTEPMNADAADLRSRYDLPPRFFICTNQLWRHKNHGVVLRGLAESRRAGTAPTVVFTGREHDYRHREYAASVKTLAAELGVGEHARFLGFLPRADQLGLVSTAIAVIQPSLCEGWSVAVEDAKALGKHVLASDIAVHREQLDRNVDFFAPDNFHALSELLGRYHLEDPEVQPLDYARNRQMFAEDLLRMLEEVSSDGAAIRT